MFEGLEYQFIATSLAGFRFGDRLDGAVEQSACV